MPSSLPVIASNMRTTVCERETERKRERGERKSEEKSKSERQKDRERKERDRDSEKGVYFTLRRITRNAQNLLTPWVPLVSDSYCITRHIHSLWTQSVSKKTCILDIGYQTTLCKYRKGRQKE